MSAKKIERATALSAEPASLGLRMPPEWAPHEATWLAFPHHRTDWPGKLAAVCHTFAEMARVISQGERVRLLVRDAAEKARAHQVFEQSGVRMEQVDFVLSPTNRSWTRDYLPLWVVSQKSARGAQRSSHSAAAVNFRFNGWARYRDHLLDDAAGAMVARRYAGALHEPVGLRGERLVLEGGSIDVDEHGTLLTTRACLLTSPLARFQDGQEFAEATLRSALGVSKILWLPDGIAGDDTSGHVDDFARFAPGGKVLICQETKRNDANFAPLKAAQRALVGATDARGKALTTVSLPMPDAVVYRGNRLPASYANFYVANAAVLVPIFNDVNDQEAVSIISQCFRDRPTIGVYARDLVVGLGTFHCSTMQQPSIG